MRPGTEIIASWPYESREAAQIVLDARGEPNEATDSLLIWHDAKPWKRIVASRAFYAHEFPAPHHDSVESFVDYAVPVEKFGDLAGFDGSVVVERTVGEMSARCHDEEANYLALNLADEIVRGVRNVDSARDYYVTEFLNARTGGPTPYMEGLRFETQEDSADPDVRAISEEELAEAESA